MFRYLLQNAIYHIDARLNDSNDFRDCSLIHTRFLHVFLFDAFSNCILIYLYLDFTTKEWHPEEAAKTIPMFSAILVGNSQQRKIEDQSMIFSGKLTTLTFK